MTMYMCPVCGYGQLSDPPLNFTICPSCGTEFGYDDAFVNHAELRIQWLRNGARWWSPVDRPPADWDAYIQVDNVASFLWSRLRETNQQTFTEFVVTGGDVLRQRVQLPSLGITARQSYTPQAA